MHLTIFQSICQQQGVFCIFLNNAEASEPLLSSIARADHTTCHVAYYSLFDTSELFFRITRANERRLSVCFEENTFLTCAGFSPCVGTGTRHGFFSSSDRIHSCCVGQSCLWFMEARCAPIVLVYASVGLGKALWLQGQGRHAEGGTTPHPLPCQF